MNYNNYINSASFKPRQLTCKIMVIKASTKGRWHWREGFLPAALKYEGETRKHNKICVCVCWEGYRGRKVKQRLAGIRISNWRGIIFTE